MGYRQLRPLLFVAFFALLTPTALAGPGEVDIIIVIDPPGSWPPCIPVLGCALPKCPPQCDSEVSIGPVDIHVTLLP